MDRACGMDMAEEECTQVIGGKGRMKEILRGPKYRWVNSITMYLRETRIGCMGCNDLVVVRNQWMAFVNMVMNLPVPRNLCQFLSNWTTCSFSSRAQLHEVSWLAFLTVTDLQNNS
jgi:hypothetical protein